MCPRNLGGHMNTTDVKLGRSGRSRRRYSDDFKAQVIEACQQPGVSMASVALANGLNANLLRRWVVEAESPESRSTVREIQPGIKRGVSSEFVQLPIAGGLSSLSDIRVEIWNGNNTIAVTWPVSEAAAWPARGQSPPAGARRPTKPRPAICANAPPAGH